MLISASTVTCRVYSRCNVNMVFFVFCFVWKCICYIIVRSCIINFRCYRIFRYFLSILQFHFMHELNIFAYVISLCSLISSSCSKKNPEYLLLLLFVKLMVKSSLGFHFVNMLNWSVSPMYVSHTISPFPFTCKFVS